METIFTLPLSLLALVQLLVEVLLLSPNVVSLPLSHAICKAKRNVAVQSGFFTVCLVLAFIFATGSAELLRDAKKARHADLRGDMATMATIDYLRAQVSCLLCLFNLSLAVLMPSLAEYRRQLDSMTKNLDAMRRQVKGMQAEYERVTSKSADSATSEAKQEADSYKAQVDKLIRDKERMQAEVDAAVKAKGSAEVRVEALLQQIKGFDKEFDRVLEENKQLQRRLAQVDSAFKPTFDVASKKDI